MVTGVPANSAATVSDPAPARYSRGPWFAPGCGGGPMMPPSTNVAPAWVTVAATARTVRGAIALASMNRPLNPPLATSAATAWAAWGGQTDSTTSARPSSAPSEPASVRPAASARWAVAGLRLSETHSTV